MIRQYTVVVTTTGSDGSATGSAKTDSTVSGEILAIHLDFSAGQAATADTTIATAHAPVRTILVTTDTATDGWYQPRAVAHDATGAAVTYDGANELYTCIPVNDQITISVAQADNNETVTATILVEQ